MNKDYHWTLNESRGGGPRPHAAALRGRRAGPPSTLAAAPPGHSSDPSRQGTSLPRDAIEAHEPRTLLGLRDRPLALPGYVETLRHAVAVPPKIAAQVHSKRPKALSAAVIFRRY